MAGEGALGMQASDFETVEVELMGRRCLRGLRCGRVGGDPWLFLHGWLDNAAAFERCLPLFLQRLGPDVDLVAIDMAGHGKSDHRQGSYLIVEFAADALLVADALSWSTFSLVGHSLGGNAAAIAAGTQPNRVSRLVLLDILGSYGKEPQEGPDALSKSIAWVAERSTGPKAGSSRLKVFASVYDAAGQRREKNIAGVIDQSSASLLAARGVVQTEDGKGFVWGSDPKLLRPSVQYLTNDSIAAFHRNIRCPTLVLLARDGLFKELLRRGGLPKASAAGNGLTVWHPLGRLFACRLFLLRVFLSALAAFLSRVGFAKRGARLRAIADACQNGLDAGVKFRAIPGARYEELPTGGHHLHMTVPEAVVGAVTAWVQSSSPAS